MLSLNEDIIHEIFSSLQNDKPVLCSLARVNRFFSSLATQYIFRNVHIRSPNIPDSRDRDEATTLELFYRSITYRPSLASLVRNLDLGWDTEKEKDEFEYHDLTNNVLAKLNMLQSFTFERLHLPYYRWKPSFLQENALPLLRSVSIINEPMTMDDFAIWLRKEGLESLYIRGMDLSEEDDSERIAFADRGIRATQLLSLCVGGYHDMNQRTLREILLVTPALRELNCKTPMTDNYTIFPAGLYESLLPVQETLVSLTMSHAHIIGLDYVATGLHRLSMKRFRSLRYLEAPAPCFFGSSEPHSSRAGVFNLLPAHLEEFKVIFPPDWKFVCYDRSRWQQIPDGEFDIEPSTYAWVEEIANQMPNLKRFDVTESFGGFTDGFVWNAPPARLSNVLDKAGISAHFMLLKPWEYA